jgi:hypothetical protein
MALNARGTTLYTLLERPLTADADQRRLLVQASDPASERFTGDWFGDRLEPAGKAAVPSPVGWTPAPANRGRRRGLPTSVQRRVAADEFEVRVHVHGQLHPLTGAELPKSDPLRIAGDAPGPVGIVDRISQAGGRQHLMDGGEDMARGASGIQHLGS